ncbi:MAG: hypothetical protein GXP32_10405 [Kiritimatiellaeota bacterium]|nr:hypothetical protein [Kiritimatiellota bacterium]
MLEIIHNDYAGGVSKSDFIAEISLFEHHLASEEEDSRFQALLNRFERPIRKKS